MIKSVLSLLSKVHFFIRFKADAFSTALENSTSGQMGAYSASLLMRNASDGKKYLYDVINIKKDDAIAVELFEKESRSRKRVQLTSSLSNITQDNDIVKENIPDTQAQTLYLHNVSIEKEAYDITQADLLTTGADANNERLYITNILQNALIVKYEKISATETIMSYKLLQIPKPKHCTSLLHT